MPLLFVNVTVLPVKKFTVAPEAMANPAVYKKVAVPLIDAVPVPLKVSPVDALAGCEIFIPLLIFNTGVEPVN